MRDFANLHVDAWVFRIIVRAGLALMFAAVLAFCAPFGTYRFNGVERVGYWTVQMVAWLLVSLAGAWLVRQTPMMRMMRSKSANVRSAAAILLATGPMIVITGFANNMMNGWQPDPGEVIELFLSIALIGGAHAWFSDQIAATFVHGEQKEIAVTTSSLKEVDVDEARVAPDPGKPDTGLIDRLPPYMATGIFCLQVEDHYVRVHALHGSTMVLMRFSDALRGVEHIPGWQVHRSWWVASDAVASLRRNGRTAQLVLHDGTLVPVSQPYLAHSIKAWGNLSVQAA